jgi:3-phenylpropionate/trans-cinnamate dioxygenase ferredoxin subunit
MSDFVTVAKLGDLPENDLKGLIVDGVAIVLINRDGVIHALEDSCSHEEFPLSAGELVGCEITCSLHGARFDIETGTPRALPAVLPVRTFEVQVEGEDVKVNLTEAT